MRGSALNIGGQQVVGARGAAIAAPAGGTAVDVEGRAAISAILAALRSHGLIAPRMAPRAYWPDATRVVGALSQP